MRLGTTSWSTRNGCPAGDVKIFRQTIAGGAKVRTSPRYGGLIPVTHRHLKRYLLDFEDKEEDWEGLCADLDVEKADNEKDADTQSDEDQETPSVVDFDDAEQEAKSYFEVEAILKAQYKQGWRFEVLWRGYPVEEATWEPLKQFALGGGRVNDTFRRFCEENDLPKALSACEALSRGMKK